MNGPHLLAPSDRGELTEALRQTTDRSRIVAGGTDLMLERRATGESPDVLIDLTRLRDAACIRAEEGVIRLGALVTCAQIQRDETLRARATCLADAAARVGSMQIRNAATVGGNVANASPCADLVTALVALEARARVLGVDGVPSERPVEALLRTDGGSALRHDEAIVEFVIPVLEREDRSAFVKIGVRTSVAVARLNAALVVSRDGPTATIGEARLAFGSLAPSSFRAHLIADSLSGQSLRSPCPPGFVDQCMDLVERSIPTRLSMPYKRLAIRGLAADLWDAIVSRV